MTNLGNIGVRGRLFLAFLGISALAVLGAVAALIAFSEVEAVVDRITRQRVPASFAALELSRQAERIAAAAPSLASDSTITQQMRSDRKLRKELAELDRLMAEMKRAQPGLASLSEIERAVTLIRQNLAELQQVIAIHPSLSSSESQGQVSERIAKSEQLLQNNRMVSERLTATVNRFIGDERTELAEAEANIAATQRKSTVALLGVVALGLISSALIVWLYVGRSIVGRLMSLRGSMRAIASGNLTAPLPANNNNDEISEMADALRIFRDKAIENERLGRLKRFLAPQVAELIVSSGDDGVLDSHRRDVAVLFCDLRGFTAFAETAEPEEIMELLGNYHTALGQLVYKFAGTLERFTGDGLIVLFNDPLPCSDPCLRAARLAVEMRAAANELIGRRRRLGIHLGFGIGIAYGYATLGRVGFEGRFDYTAIGSVVNLAARLCESAKASEILIDSKVYAAIDGHMKTEPLEEFIPKGFSRPIEVFNLVGPGSHSV
jgi:class 3 adenylate cyclase